MYELTYSLFLDFLAGRPSVICNIKNYADNLCVKKDALIFSLRALHDYLSQSCAEKIDYSEFQKIIFLGSSTKKVNCVQLGPRTLRANVLSDVFTFAEYSGLAMFISF